MTPASRQRLNELMTTIDYQRRSARRILILLAIAGVVALCMAAVTGCTIAHHPTAGTYGSLGGDSRGIEFNQGGFSIAENNNSASFQEARKAVSTYIMTRGLVDAADIMRRTNETNVAADVSKHATDAATSVKVSEINAAVETAKIVTP